LSVTEIIGKLLLLVAIEIMASRFLGEAIKNLIKLRDSW